jgi:hypothetical protein
MHIYRIFDHFVEYVVSKDDKSWIESCWPFQLLCVTLWHSATVASNFIMETDSFGRQITATQWIDRGLSSHKTLRRSLAIIYGGTTDIVYSICRYCACLILLVELSSCDKDTQSEGLRVKVKAVISNLFLQYIILNFNFNGLNLSA